jgi:CO/xanthine dehydrogenase Mo-binding subunit
VDILRRKAAEFWKVSEDDVEWRQGRARRKRRRESLGLAQLASLSNGEPLCGFGHYEAESPDIYSFQAMAAEVEVDGETGEVRIRRLCFAYDVTKVINPIIHQGQIDGAVIQGVGFPMMEHLAMEDGRVVTLSLGDYKIPTIRDVPPLTTSLVKAREGFGPFGTKSVAECGISVVAPAVANAIYDATGVRVARLPVKAENILAALRSGDRKVGPT